MDIKTEIMQLVEEEKKKKKKKKKKKTVETTNSNVYTYTSGNYDVLADTSLEGKITEFGKKINELEECYKDLSNRLEVLDGNGIWKSEHQKELYSYVKGSIISTFNKRIEDWNTFREFLITVLQSYTEFDETYDSSIDKNKDEFNINENKNNYRIDENKEKNIDKKNDYLIEENK